MNTNLLYAFLLTLLAGLSTGIGSMLAFFTKKTNKKCLSLSLGFSSGVMLYVSFVEMLGEAKETLVSILGDKAGSIATIAAFFGGILVIAVIDKLVPTFENPHEIALVEEMVEIDKLENSLENMENENKTNRHIEIKDKSIVLYRMGIFSAVAISLHNFPEGLVTFISSLKDPHLGISIAIAIALHNIPEGIAVSIPIYYATGSKKKAFFYSLLSGVAEPLGAIIGFIFLRSHLNETVFGLLFSAVAGIMVFISLDELLPTAQKYGEHHLSIYGLVFGMIFMALTLVFL